MDESETESNRAAYEAKLKSDFNKITERVVKQKNARNARRLLDVSEKYARQKDKSKVPKQLLEISQHQKSIELSLYPPGVNKEVYTHNLMVEFMETMAKVLEVFPHSTREETRLMEILLTSEEPGSALLAGQLSFAKVKAVVELKPEWLTEEQVRTAKKVFQFFDIFHPPKMAIEHWKNRIKAKDQSAVMSGLLKDTNPDDQFLQKLPELLPNRYGERVVPLKEQSKWFSDLCIKYHIRQRAEYNQVKDEPKSDDEEETNAPKCDMVIVRDRKSNELRFHSRSSLHELVDLTGDDDEVLYECAQFDKEPEEEDENVQVFLDDVEEPLKAYCLEQGVEEQQKESTSPLGKSLIQS